MKWEYRWVQTGLGRIHSSRGDDEINRLGAEGWEAVGVTADYSGTVTVLVKRPVEA